MVYAFCVVARLMCDRQRNCRSVPCRTHYHTLTQFMGYWYHTWNMATQGYTVKNGHYGMVKFEICIKHFHQIALFFCHSLVPMVQTIRMIGTHLELYLGSVVLDPGPSLCRNGDSAVGIIIQD